MASPVRWQDVLDTLSVLAKENDVENLDHKYPEEELVKRFLCGKYRDELLKWIENMINSSPWRKCEEKSQRLREEGNKFFKGKNFLMSVNYYSESLRYAKPNTKEFALSVANRAAGLIEIGFFEDALQDIDLAIAHGYPKSSQYKLFQRKGNCLLHLKKYEEAKAALKLAQENLELVCKDFTAGQEGMKYASKRIENLLENVIAKQKGSDFAACGQDEKPVLPNLVCGESKTFPSASKLLSLQQDEVKGRHVTAIDDLSVGDVLFVEKPFAFVLLPAKYRKRCQHCCSMFVTPIPCWNCSLVLYCCDECRSQSWNKYHKWECHGGLAVIDNVGIAHLGLRVVLVAGCLETHKNFREILSKEANCEDRYSAVYHLVTNLETMSVDDRAAYSLTAACLTLYLEYFTNYFVGNSHEETPAEASSSSSAVNNDDIVLIGGLIMRHICQLVCNGHAIIAVEENVIGDKPNKNVKEIQQTRIATAIYPSASMMNHSCDPNIINSFLDTTIIIKAYKNIKKGEEVFNCYGPNYRTSSWQKRQDVLRAQYHFECSCNKCIIKSDFEEQFTAILCPFCKGAVRERDVKNDAKCRHCGKRMDCSKIVSSMQKCRQLHDEGCKLLEQGNAKAALEQLMPCLSLQEKFLHRDNKYRSMLLDNIAKGLAMIGDFEKSVSYLQRTIPAVEKQFGSWSTELGYELQKLAGLMLSDLHHNTYDKLLFVLKYEEATEVIQKAKEIFKLHFGPWNHCVKYAIANEKQLNDMMAIMSVLNK